MPQHPCLYREKRRTRAKIEQLLCGLLACGSLGICSDVVVQPTQQFQTIVGWGHGGGVLGGTAGSEAFLPPSLADPVNYQYLDYLTDELGLTGTRTWEVGPRIDGRGTDNGDCDRVDWNLFESDTLSAQDAAYLVHYQNRILAEGYQPSFYSSPGYPTHASDQKPWVMNHPGERAQQIWASSLYLKTNYGINISYAVIYNEPSMASTILTDDIKALGPRFDAQGLPTRSQYAEAVAPQTDWGYITPVFADPDVWQYVGRISYHNYGTADPYRSYLRDYGNARNLTAAQTEMGNPTFDDLYADLTIAGVSYWEVAYSGGNTLVNNPGLTAFTPSGTFFRLHEVMHYVRPGAVRIGALAEDPSLHVLAFLQNGKVTAVIENNSSSVQTINLSGLPAGNYGLSKSASGATSFQELGIRTVGANGLLTLTNVAGSSAVTTLYPYPGTNQPPTVEVWGANPGYVVAPANSATLTVTASDPELAALTYHWSVISQPPGANAIIGTANANNTFVSGLTIAGTYIFNVDVSDGSSTVSRKVYVAVYDSNPPPVLGQTGFRIAAPYGLVFGNPGGVTHATVELPTTTAVLQAGISDLANSDFTGRGTWSLVSQPPGANAGVSSTTYIFVSLRANATNMTVPGDYLFQINVTNPGHPDLTAQILCTINPASSPPVISSITASPTSVTLPTNSLQLSAITSGSTNQPLRHWWVVKTVPVGAKPVFDHQGTTNTTVGNLNLPGSYTFTLRAFDDLHMTTQDKTINVVAAAGAPVFNSPALASVIAGMPFTYNVSASGNPIDFSVSNLPPELKFSSGLISGTPTIVGSYNIQLVATNANGVGYGNLALTVKLPRPVITSSATADGQLNAPFSFTIQATSVATSFGATGLPGGLTLNSLTGVITGTPTNSGTFGVTVTAANATGSSTNPLTILIYNGAPPVPIITSALTVTGIVSAGFNYQITATNNPTSFFAIGLPLGLSFDPASGGIVGIPLDSGNFMVTLRASNHGGTGTAVLTLNVSLEPPPRIDSISVQNGTTLLFLTLTNRFYEVDWLSNLLSSDWTTLTNQIAGDGATQAVTDAGTNAPARFYRLKVTMP